MVKNLPLTKDTKVVIFLALLVGLIYVFPHIIYLHEPGQYNPLYVAPSRAFMDESIYAAGVEKVLEGHLIPSDLTLPNINSGIFIYGPVPFIIIALLAKICAAIVPTSLISQPIISTIILSDFIFAALTFLIFYFLSKIITKSHRISIISSLLLLFFYRLFIPPPTLSPSSIVQFLFSAVTNFTKDNTNFWLSRFVHPQISLPLLLITIIVTYLAITKKEWKYYVLLTLSLALNIYTYFYNWTYLLIFFITVFTITQLQSKKINIKFILSFILLVCLAIPYVINSIELKSADITLRSGIQYGHFFEPISILYIILLFIIIIIVINKNQKDQNQSSISIKKVSLLQKARKYLETISAEDIIIISTLVAAIISINIQLVTGYTIQNDHYHSRVIVPIILLTIGYIVTKIVPRKMKESSTSNKLKFFYVSSVVLILILATFNQIQETIGQHQTYSFTKDQYELLTFLQSEVPKESVILTSDLTWNMWIPAYTTNHLFFPYSASTLASKEEMENRFYYTYDLFNYTPEQMATDLNAPSSYTRIQTSKNVTSLQTYLRSYIYLDELYPVEIHGILKERKYNQFFLTSLVERYPLFQRSHPSLLEKYHVDYILLTADQKETLQTAEKNIRRNNNTLQTVFENDQFTLLKIN